MLEVEDMQVVLGILEVLARPEALASQVVQDMLGVLDTVVA